MTSNCAIFAQGRVLGRPELPERTDQDERNVFDDLGPDPGPG